MTPDQSVTDALRAGVPATGTVHAQLPAEEELGCLSLQNKEAVDAGPQGIRNVLLVLIATSAGGISADRKEPSEVR